MVNILYCDVIDVDQASKMILAAGPHVGLPMTHTHPTGPTEEVCKEVLNVAGEDTPRTYPHLCGDGATTVNNANEWITYLEGFLP